MNTSEFGQNLVGSNSALSDLHTVGIHDFYTANILGYCEGYFNSKGGRNYTYCSKPQAFFEFDPKAILQADVDAAGYSDINISELDWPTEIDNGLTVVHKVEKAAFILYIVAVALIALATVSAAVSVCLYGRLSAFINVMLSGLAFIAVGLASAVVTVAGIKGSSTLDKYGDTIDISASYGKQFLIFTWISTACMVICSMSWCVGCIVGDRSHRYRAARFDEKPAGY